MKINGIEFDDPREGLSKRDYAEYAEGKRTKVREMWVSSYVRENGAVALERHRLTLNNHGVCTFDDRPVRDEAEKHLAAELFDGVNPD